MSMERGLGVVFIGGLVTALLAGRIYAQGVVDPCGGVPCVGFFNQTPVGSGGEPPLDLYAGAPNTVSGATLVGGLQVNSAVTGVTFEHLIVTTDSTSNLVFEPVAGSDWTVTAIRGGFEFDAGPRAHAIGEAGLLRTGGMGYYGLEFTVDNANSNASGVRELSSAHFTFEAVPEPGMLILGGLFVCGGLFVRSCRRK